VASEALQLFLKQKFTVQSGSSVGQGVTQNSFWYANTFSLPTSSCHGDWYFSVEYPNLDWLEVYFYNSETLVYEKLSGDRRPFGQRDLDHRFFYFKVPLREFTAENPTVLIRTASSGALNLPMNLDRFETIFAKDHNSQMLFGIYIGAVIVMAIYYALIGGLSLHLQSIYLACFLVSISMFRHSFHGVVFEYLLPDYPQAANIAVIAFGFLSAISLTYYSERFLETDKNPRFKRGLGFGKAALWIGFFASLYFEYKMIKLSVALSILVPIFWLLIGTRSWLSGFAPAKYFVAAWGAFFAALSSISFLNYIALTGYGSDQLLIATLPELALVVMTVLLSVGASEKFRLTNRLALEAQQRSLEAQIEARKVTEEANIRLETAVAQRTAELRKQTREMQVVFDAVRQGLCVIDEWFKIQPQVSLEFSTFIEETDFVGRSLVDLFIRRTDIAADTLSLMETVVTTSIGSHIINYEVNSHVFPVKASLVTKGGPRDVELEWDPITDTNDHVIGILVAIRDVTKLKIAEKEAALHRANFEKIGRTIAIPAAKMSLFLDSSERLLQNCYAAVMAPPNQDLFLEILRCLHTLKGNSRAYGLSDLALVLHETEHAVLRFKSEKAYGSDLIALKSLLDPVHKLVTGYRDINDHLLNRSGLAKFEKAFSDFSKHFTSIFASLDKSSRRALTPSMQELHELVSHTFFKSIKPLTESLEPIARQLNKPSPTVRLEGDDFDLPLEEIPYIESIFTHLFRNSLDHGFTADQKGVISVRVERTVNHTRIIYSDCGRGLALQKLRQTSETLLGLKTTASAIEVAQLIFLPGVSCAARVSEISGRGIGMNAVAEMIKELRGSIEIELTGDNPDSEYMPFRMIIRLPTYHSLREVMNRDAEFLVPVTS
jgi:two-component sensor histidine kinase/PAS domain-containing protein